MLRLVRMQHFLVFQKRIWKFCCSYAQFAQVKMCLSGCEMKTLPVIFLLTSGAAAVVFLNVMLFLDRHTIKPTKNRWNWPSVLYRGEPWTLLTLHLAARNSASKPLACREILGWRESWVRIFGLFDWVERRWIPYQFSRSQTSTPFIAARRPDLGAQWLTFHRLLTQARLTRIHVGAHWLFPRRTRWDRAVTVLRSMLSRIDRA